MLRRPAQRTLLRARRLREWEAKKGKARVGFLACKEGMRVTEATAPRLPRNETCSRSQMCVKLQRQDRNRRPNSRIFSMLCSQSFPTSTTAETCIPCSSSLGS